jgi:hypothetical protein
MMANQQKIWDIGVLKSPFRKGGLENRGFKYHSNYEAPRQGLPIHYGTLHW